MVSDVDLRQHLELIISDKLRNATSVGSEEATGNLCRYCSARRSCDHICQLLGWFERGIEDQQTTIAVTVALNTDYRHGVTWLLEEERRTMRLAHFGDRNWSFGTLRKVSFDKVEQLIMCSPGFRVAKRVHGVIEIQMLANRSHLDQSQTSMSTFIPKFCIPLGCQSISLCRGRLQSPACLGFVDYCPRLLQSSPGFARYQVNPSQNAHDLSPLCLV